MSSKSVTEEIPSLDITDDESPNHQFTNGDNIHFDYSNDTTDPISISCKKKKKKKKKNKNKSKTTSFEAASVEVNDVNAQYPSSRIIKQASNGDVVVEGIETGSHPENHNHTSQFTNIWDNASSEERENLKAFWKSLPEEEKLKLIDIEKNTIISQFKSQQKVVCACGVCGRKKHAIEEELESIYERYYDRYYDDLFSNPHSLADDDDGIAGVLFHNRFSDTDLGNRMNNLSLRGHTRRSSQSDHYDSNITPACGHAKTDENPSVKSTHPHSHTSIVPESKEEDIPHVEQKTTMTIGNNEINFHFDGEGVIEYTANGKKIYKTEDEIWDSITSNKEMLKKMFTPKKQKINGDKDLSSLEELDKKGYAIMSVADDILNHEGRNFISMMEKLAVNRIEREADLKNRKLKEISSTEEASVPDGLTSLTDSESEDVLDYDDEDEEDEDDGKDEDEYEEVDDESDDMDHHKHHIPVENNGSIDADNENSGDVSESEESNDENDQGDSESNASAEYSEEQKVEEIRRLFLIQVTKLFHSRLKEAYKAKLADDRTKSLIEELEQEEEAKRQKELKKVKQKEKAKEKKRLQQLAKEEERIKKEEDERLKQERVYLELEAAKEVQRLKKEEARKKKEADKQKKIDEMKRKEAEKQKKDEIKRKKEEELRKQKEDLRKKREEEKQEKETLKRQKEEERIRKEEELRLEEEEKMRVAEQNRTKHQQELESRSLDVRRASNTNHLLDELYHAKPRTLSNSSPRRPTSTILPPGLSPSPSMVGSTSLFTNQSVASNASIIPQANTSPRSESPWGMSNSLNTQSQFGLYPNGKSNSIFSLPSVKNNGLAHNGNMTLDQMSTTHNQIPATPFDSSTNAANHSTLWSPSQISLPQTPSLYGSIWNPPATSATWNMPPISANGTSQMNSLDINKIQEEIFRAYDLVISSCQVLDGLAPIQNVFEITKTLLSNQTLSFAMFLSYCQNQGLTSYRFDLKHDDIGIATHIKITNTYMNDIQLPHQQQQHQHLQSTPTPLNNHLVFQDLGSSVFSPYGRDLISSNGDNVNSNIPSKLW